MGSNMAECHPVGFQWVIEAQERGAKVIHVDPRFTRTSAIADLHVPIRAGSDIAFLGGIVHHILEHGREFREYVVRYTNAATIVERGLRRHRGPRRAVLRLGPGGARLRRAQLAVRGRRSGDAGGRRRAGASERRAVARAHGAMSSHGDAPEQDPTLQHPRCVFQILRRHFARYTPEIVVEICGVPEDQFLAVAEALCDNSGRERTSAICYAVGWTQHTVGVQIHPRRGDHPAAARQHRAPRRRHPRAARPRLDPGLDRHPDALQHPARLPADAQRPRRTPTLDDYLAVDTRRRPASGAAWTPTWSAC